MGAFEYLSVLISIVLGLGITHVLLGFGQWLERRDRFRPYGPALAWASFVLLLHIQTWWTMFGYQGHASWNFLQFAVVLLQPIVLFLLALVVLPSGDAPDPDLEANFHRQRPWLFGLLIALLAVSVLKDLVRDGDVPDGLNLAFHGVFLGIAVAGSSLKRDAPHRVLAYSALGILLVYIVVLFFEL